MNTQPFFIKVLTPLHAGSGSDLGVVDLPIQRESHTSFPKIEASSLKGCIRSKIYDDKLQAKSEEIQEIRQKEIQGKSEEEIKEIKDKEEKIIKDAIEKELEAVFGKSDEAGKLGFSDARILFFPVKSVKGVFAYVTCPMVLERYTKDTGSEALASPKEISFPKSLGDGECFVLGDKNTIENKDKTKKTVILEEYSFEVTKKLGEVKTSLPKGLFDDIEKRIVIISDDNFKHFVQNSTEVITRIRIAENGVVDKIRGGLFTEEFLPAESVMYALAIGKVEEFTKAEKTTLQIGGDTNLGKGIVEITIGVKVEVEK
ncbi:MAG: type III-B CRISPR module RAMP protein Cmr4 [Sulfuricurvum sp.]